MTIKIDAAAAATEILTSLTLNVEELEKALQIAKQQINPGYVFVWPEYWLGVRLVAGGKVNGCRLDQGFVTHRADRRVFTNGHGVQAVLMPLVRALEGALAHGIEVRTQLTDAISKQA